MASKHLEKETTLRETVVEDEEQGPHSEYECESCKAMFRFETTNDDGGTNPEFCPMCGRRARVE